MKLFTDIKSFTYKSDSLGFSHDIATDYVYLILTDHMSTARLNSITHRVLLVYPRYVAGLVLIDGLFVISQKVYLEDKLTFWAAYTFA